MKKFIFIMWLILLSAALSAQTGLFGLSYGDDLNKADSLMLHYGFVAQDIEGCMVKYNSEYDKLVEAVVLFVDPETEILAGWFVKYSAANTKEQDDYVVDRMHRMHGDEVKIDENSEQLIWGLGDTKSVHLQFVGDNLTVLYYDSAKDDLFALPPNSNDKETPGME